MTQLTQISQYGNFNEPDILFEKNKLDNFILDNNESNKNINLENKLKTYDNYNFYNLPASIAKSNKSINQQIKTEDIKLQSQNVLISEKVKNNIYSKISVSDYQNEEINRMYDKLKRLEILKTIEDNINKQKTLYDVSIKELINRILNEWFIIYQKIFDNVEFKNKLDTITNYPLSVGIFFILISICIFLSI
jgi:hypothetical protein